MAVNLSKLFAKRGEPIIKKWNLLIEFIKQTDVIVGSEGVRVRKTPNGTVVTVDRNFAAFPHPFRVRRTGDQFSVREGTVAGLLPYIEKVDLSGRDEGGNEKDVPRIKATNSRGSDATYLAVVATPIVTTRGVGLESSPDTLRIEHIDSLDGVNLNTGGVTEKDGRVIYPIARIDWDSKGNTIREVFQIVHHNLNHRYVQGNAQTGVSSRHFFWAA